MHPQNITIEGIVARSVIGRNGCSGIPAYVQGLVDGESDRDRPLDTAFASPEWRVATAQTKGMGGRRIILITEEVDLLMDGQDG